MKGRIVTFLLMYSFALNIWSQEDTLRIVRNSLRMMQEASDEMSMDPLLFPANEPMNLFLQKILPSYPIAVPYFKFKNGAKFGLDVGGLLYDIFRDNSFKREIRNDNFPNPTIAPHRPKIEIR